MNIKMLVIFVFVFTSFSCVISQINCDAEWVKRKGIQSVLIAGEDLAGGYYSEYFEYALSGNVIYYEKYSDHDKYVMRFNDKELLISEIFLKRTDLQSTKWDTSKVYSYSYDSINNLKTWTLKSYEVRHGELVLVYSSCDYYDYSDSLIIITTEDYSEYKSSNETLVEQKILNRLGQDSIIVIMTGHGDALLDTFSISKLSYDNLGRKEKIETNSSAQIEITDFVYYRETDFKITETTTTTDLNGVFREKKVKQFYRESNDLKSIEVTDSKNNVEKRNFDKGKISCGLKFHMKEVKSSKAKVTIEYYN